MEHSEGAPKIERMPNPETRRHIPSPEFSRRVLLGATNKDALDSKKTLPVPENTQELGTFANRDYSLFHNRSNDERHEIWKDKAEQGTDAQKAAWKESVQETFDRAKTFFTETPKGQKWADTIHTFGITADNVTGEQLDAFFTKYTTTDAKTGGVKQFMSDILSADRYKNIEGKLDMGKLQADLPALEWLANLFGENSAQVITRLTHAEAQLQSKPQALLNKDQKQSDQEVELLQFLAGKDIPPKNKEKETKTDPIDPAESDSVSNNPKQLIEQAVKHGVEQSAERRIQDQALYIERIKERYTVDNLNANVRLTRTTKENPNDTRVPEAEREKADKEARRLQAYLNLLNEKPRNYIEELEEVNTTLPPMQAETALSIVIPAYNEGSRIEKTLDSWINQLDSNDLPLDPKKIELLILVNRPNTQRDFDDTYEKIEAFKKAHPEYARSIQVVKKTFNFGMEDMRKPDGTTKKVPEVKMGLIYRYAADLAILRNLNREGKDPDRIANHLMRTGAADVVGRSPYHIKNILASFEADTGLEQYVSLSEYPPEIYKKIPLLFVTKYLQDGMNDELTNDMSHIGLGTYRAALYAEAGGFEGRMPNTEEMELSKRMRREIKRRFKKVEDVRKRDKRLNALDDPRRDIAALFAGKEITHAYDDYNSNEAIRDLKLADVLTSPLPEAAALTPEHVSQQATGIFKKYLNEFYNPAKDMPEPKSTETTIRHLKTKLGEVGISSEYVHILFDGKPFDLDEYNKEITENPEGINAIRRRFSVSVDLVPDVSQLMKAIEEHFKKIDGDWVYKMPIPASPAA